jgi:uncharacterized membrane protein YidH (DUF202 family)
MYRKFERLIRRGFLTPSGLSGLVGEAEAVGGLIEELLLQKGIPKHEILFALSEYYNLPFVEYDENLSISRSVLKFVDFEQLKAGLWVPLSVFQGRAEVIAYRPEDPALAAEIRKTLSVEEVDFKAALARDIVRIIENNFDLNPGFPPSAGRTPLALVRTYLAERRSAFAEQRTSLAKGRTGLAFLRTGVAFIAIAVALFRLFGPGYLLIIEGILLIAGIVAVADGLKWYLPARRSAKSMLDYTADERTSDFSVLEVSNPGTDAVFRRSRPVPGANELRKNWRNLSPVMRRRFLANDRTDMAEERTVLACVRTRMAKARTGLAFARSGVAFSGLGIGLLRQFHLGRWSVFDAALIAAGVFMSIEGILWYRPAKQAGREGLKAVMKAEQGWSIWESAFPPFYRAKDLCVPPVRASHLPGVWATTGLALERTVLADRRNVMARLRTIMARSRTAMAFIRTGLSFVAVGAALLIYFAGGAPAWIVFESALVAGGLVLVADGIRWYVPAERERCMFPYCFGDFEIPFPDYTVPGRFWKKVVFSHDDL